MSTCESTTQLLAIFWVFYSVEQTLGTIILRPISKGVGLSENQVLDQQKGMMCTFLCLSPKRGLSWYASTLEQRLRCHPVTHPLRNFSNISLPSCFLFLYIGFRFLSKSNTCRFKSDTYGYCGHCAQVSNIWRSYGWHVRLQLENEKLIIHDQELRKKKIESMIWFETKVQAGLLIGKV